MTPKIALYGLPGAGKSTLAHLLVEEATSRGWNSSVVKIAEPLYDIQRYVYERAGLPLQDAYQQDGMLLNVLGENLKRINPNALIDDIAQRVADLDLDHIPICDDMRGDAAPKLANLGFTLVQVTAPDQLRRQRKQKRADLTAGDDKHVTEVPVSRDPDYQIVNDGDLDKLRAQASYLIERVAR
ncbi:AAA family ATPase (plasmid) [Nocardiopsis eucommiae]|uniref:AAA family ATPase n=1 Tax=Nocardiopsis eucommiae TaxID=2831970 RepID=A0A975QMN0_9ACTN|nr:AAA family ATPase [Nocardiopsis eucommiae]